MSPRDSLLKRELKQTRPFRSTGHEATIALLRTADLLRRRLADLIAPAGITTQQYNVLRILRGAAPDGLPTLEIAERMIERAPGITRLIDRLEDARLVVRERRDDDRRVVACRITPAGTKLLAGLDETVDRADADAVGMLSRTDQERLIRILEAIRSAPDAVATTTGAPRARTETI